MDSVTPSPTATPTLTPSETWTDQPTATITHTTTATWTEEPSRTATPTLRPTATRTDLPTATPTHTPTATWTEEPTHTATPTPTNTPVVLLAVGDIAKCGGGPPSPNSGAQITSDMLLDTPGNLFSLGDNSNDTGSPSDYSTCFDPTWGRLKNRLYPVMGNHDQIYGDHQGTPYFEYFGAPAHPESFGHYSLNLGDWHIVVLNAECGIGNQGCGAGSPQEKWLQQDLAANPKNCILAIWHQPLFTSGTQSETPGMAAFWQDLYAVGADLILNGHNHNYERFAPQDPNRNPDPNGIREFVVGTGGASLDPSILPLASNQEVRSAAAYGYLKLTLKPGSYDWQFIAQPGKTFTDSGSGTCH